MLALHALFRWKRRKESSWKRPRLLQRRLLPKMLLPERLLLRRRHQCRSTARAPAVRSYSKTVGPFLETKNEMSSSIALDAVKARPRMTARHARHAVSLLGSAGATKGRSNHCTENFLRCKRVFITNVKGTFLGMSESAENFLFTKRCSKQQGRRKCARG
jgi:hypothetical protein